MNGNETILRRIILPAVLIAALPLSTAISSAFTRADLEMLKTKKSCEKCNLRSANLAGVDLSKAYLPGAELNGANLRRANLSGANLSGARMIDAVLSEANLSGANLRDADLFGAYMTDTKLTGADLSGAKWTDGAKCKAGSVGQCDRGPGRVKK